MKTTLLEIDFYVMGEPSSEIEFSVFWPCCPREGDTLSFENKNYHVVDINWDMKSSKENDVMVYVGLARMGK